MPDDGTTQSGVQTPLSLEARIYAAYPTLNPAGRRFADILLEQQMNLAKRTAGELARKAGVSPSTAARLIRALGYASYPDAKRRIRSEQHWGSPRAGLSDPGRVTPETLSLARMVQADIDNIQATAANISERTLHAVSDALVTARRIWIVGLRSGFGLAQHAGHYFGLIRRDVRVLSGSEPSYSRWIASVDKGVTERLGEASHDRFETIDRLVKLMDDVSLPREDKR